MRFNEETYRGASQVLAQRGAKKVGLTNKAKFLGEGAYGAVFQTAKNKAVKITSSKVEADNAVLLIGKKFRHVVNIYSVNKVTISGFDYWLIEMEKLTPGNKSEISRVVGWNGDEFYCKKYPKSKVFKDLSKGTKALKRLGIYHNDIHEGNVMYKNGRYKLIDVM